MSHDDTCRRVFGVTLETVVRRIVRTFDRATAADLESGARWYLEAGALASDLAPYAGSRAHAAVVIAHLSPRTSWTRNVQTATLLVQCEDGADAARAAGAMRTNVERALASLEFEDPFDSFGPGAPKTRSFARNILGDDEAVTVDVWACRVADLDESALGRVGAYDAIAHAYRLAARRRGVAPATMQATTWVVARNGRAA